MAPNLFQTERNCAELAIYEHCPLSPVPRVERIGPSTRQSAAFSELYVNPTNWVAEREGFEPPEPLGSPDFESGRLNQTPEPLRDRRASMFAPAQSSWSTSPRFSDHTGIC